MMAENKTASKIPDKPPDPASDTFLGAFSDTAKTGFTKASDVIDWVDYGARGPAKPTPPKPLNIPDRATFEQGVFKQLGVNPFKLNVMDSIISADKKLPELFRGFFKGQVSWYDREKLSKKQLDAWQDLVKRYHAFTEAKATAYKNQKIDEYNWLMGNYEADIAKRETVYGKKWQRYQSELGAWEKEAGKKPTAPEKPSITEQRIVRKLNQIAKRFGGKIDINAMMMMSPEARDEYLKQQSSDLLKRIPEPYKAKYLELEKQLYGTTQAMPAKPKTLSKEKAQEYLNKAGGDKDKARKLAKDDGYQF